MQKTKGAGKIKNIQCNEILIPAFPNLRFGEHFDGSNFFDATFYINTLATDHNFNVEDFFTYFNYQIQSIVELERKDMDSVVYINQEGHQLIDGCLCYLFLSYVDPQFCVYCNSVLDELFITGFVISDTNLLTLVKHRLSPELCKQIWEDEGTLA